MKTRKTALLSLLVASGVAMQVACGGGGPEVKAPDGKNNGKPVISAAAEKGFNAAIEAFVAHDKANDWNDAACADIAKKFDAVAAEEKAGKLAEATFNAGLAYQRCGNEKEAKARFQKALTDNPKFHYARAQIALYDYKASTNEDATIASLQQAVLDSQFENVPALVNLAMVQMARDGATGGQDCKDDFDCAKKNLQRALAKDDAYMPAFNQLALYYFQLAKKRAGSVKGTKGKRQIATNAAMGKRADVQQLELAALVCSQAIRKNPGYAPIHNTAGLIQNELGLVNSAVGEFATAAKLDPRLFEAQMNFAAVNLSFRGFEQAESAYRNALQMRPNDYDAHLGLALALRGRIDDVNYDKQVAAVQAELDAAKKIDPNRPDAYYNEGILTQEYKAKGLEQAKQIATLEQAQGILRTFTEKASGKAEYDGAVKRSKERIEDMDVMKEFIKGGGNVNKAPPPVENTGDAPAGGAAGGAPADPAKKP